MDSPSVPSPFKTVFDSVGPQHEKALKQAFYNTAALVFVLLSGIITVSAYYVLEVFLRPLVWAALCGTFLYPFKKASTQIVRDWLKKLQEENTPFMIGVSILPFKMLGRSSDFLGGIVKSNYKLISSIFVLVPFCYYLVVFHPFYQIILSMQIIANIVVKILAFFNYPLAVWSIFIGYAILLLLYKTQYVGNIHILKCVSTGVWFMMLFHLVSLAGSWKVPLALVLCLLIILGIINEKKHSVKKHDSNSPSNEDKKKLSVKNIVDRTLSVFGIPTASASAINVNNSESTADLQEHSLDTSQSSVESLGETKSLPVDETLGALINPNVEALKSTPIPAKKNVLLQNVVHSKTKKARKQKRIGKSDPYFIALFWLFAISRVWMHMWIIEVLPFLIFIYIFKTVFIWLELRQLLLSKIQPLLDSVYGWYAERKDIIFPSPVKGVVTMIHTGDQKVIAFTHGAMDKLMSIWIILCLAVLALTGAAFFAVQVHHESSYLIKVATNVVNKTIISNEEYLKWMNLNSTDVKRTFDSTIHSAYIIARKKMAGIVSSSLRTKESNASKIEDQITQFLDQLYEAWIGKNDSTKNEEIKEIKVMDNTNNNTQPKGFLKHQWYKVTQFVNTNDLSNVFGIIKENLHTLSSVIDSIWQILKGNMNLVFSIMTHVISMVFFSGTYLLNIVISTIIFSTTLFYLLSSSSNEYKLVEWFSGVSMGTRLGESINKAIQDVFGASLKMATFYGLYTWLTHSVFGANLIFIPAALAATFGVVPFIGTYWAAVPAALEIWLIQQEQVLAILLLALHMLPTYVVDTAIYSEIDSGGHPYLTGLAVAGGVYCIGLEGAFVGPIVLCCLIAAFNVYDEIMNNSSLNEGTQIPSLACSANRRWRRAISEDPI